MFSAELRRKAESLVQRYPVGRSALLPLLHLVQSQDGYISPDGVAECAELLGLTKAEVGAVATFYTMYKRNQLGRHLVSVCTNFSCKVRGAEEVYHRLEQVLGVGHNGTTEDNALTLEHAECLGNCEGAPVVTVDYFNYECVTPDQAEELVKRLRAGEVPPPTRGVPSPGIRAVSHRLAGLGPPQGEAQQQASTADASQERPEPTKTEVPDETPLHTGTDLGTPPDAAFTPEREQQEREARAQVRDAGVDADTVESETGYSTREFATTSPDAEEGFAPGDPRKEDQEAPAPQDQSRLLRGRAEEEPRIADEPQTDELNAATASPEGDVRAADDVPVDFPGGEPGASSTGRGEGQPRDGERKDG